MNFCPARAVEASHPLAAGMFYVAGIPVADYLLNKADNLIPFADNSAPLFDILNNGLTAFLLQYAYFLISVCLMYFIFSVFNRIPALSKVFKVVTLTHYYRRYHEPDTTISDLTGSRQRK